MERPGRVSAGVQVTCRGLEDVNEACGGQRHSARCHCVQMWTGTDQRRARPSSKLPSLRWGVLPTAVPSTSGRPAAPSSLFRDPGRGGETSGLQVDWPQATTTSASPRNASLPATAGRAGLPGRSPSDSRSPAAPARLLAPGPTTRGAPVG